MHHRLSRLAAALVLGAPLLAAAQARAPSADKPPPARPLTPASAFADYAPYCDIAPGDWRRLNDTVGRAGLRPEPTPPQAGHSHGMHGGPK